MSQVVIVYHSGYGHTQRIAECMAEASGAQLIAINPEGQLLDTDWEILAAADAIIFGAPTYMGSPSWQFKRFSEASSKPWFKQLWLDKVFGGFTVSASLNGDKQVSLISMQTLASQHGGIWVSLGMLPSNHSAATRQDINNLGGSVGLLIQAPSDAGADAIPQGDIETARRYACRIASIADRLRS